MIDRTNLKNNLKEINKFLIDLQVDGMVSANVRVQALRADMEVSKVLEEILEMELLEIKNAEQDLKNKLIERARHKEES
jgi:hypothetical protein